MGCLFSSSKDESSSSGAKTPGQAKNVGNAGHKTAEALQNFAAGTPLGEIAVDHAAEVTKDAAAEGRDEGQEDGRDEDQEAGSEEQEDDDGGEDGVGDGALPPLKLVQSAVKSVKSLVGSSPSERKMPPNIQDIQLKERHPAEKTLAKYSELGKVVLRLSGPAAAAFPFGAPAAAMLGAVYGRATQAAKNSNNCKQLLTLMKRCDKQIARAARGIAERAEKGQPVDPEVNRGMAQLTQRLLDGAEIMDKYTNRGFIMRTISSTSDRADFQNLDAGIRRAMERVSFEVAIGVLEGKYSDESGPLRDAVCKAAKRPESEASQALQDLRRDQPDLLRKLLHEKGKFSDQVVASEMEAISERLDKVEARVSKVEALVELSVKNGSAPPPGLAGFLASWWKQEIHRLKPATSTKEFVEKLLSWAKDNDLVPQILEYEETLDQELEESGMSASSLRSLVTVTISFEGKPLLFLDQVFLPLLDQDKNGSISLSKLRRLQLIAYGFAVETDFQSVNESGTNEPSSWQELFDAIYRGFNRAKLTKPSLGAANDGLRIVTEALNVKDVLTYDTASLLDNYIEGTRRWMFDRVNAWLGKVLGELDNASPDSEVVPDSRLFLLLAGPGMGKSVFSAALQTKMLVKAHTHRELIQVRHFFKVGQMHAQGKAMVLSLTQQLCEQLPGMVDLLLPVVKEHGNGASLSLTEAFQTFLLDPLSRLDKHGSERGKHVVIILLDALDEACDGPSDFEAVTALIAREFIKLPAWIKIVATGRPEAQASLAAWAPVAVWIKPEDEQNQADMSLLLKACLRRGGGLVADKEMEAAARLLLEKSQGHFVYAKYANDILMTKPSWNLSELEDALPTGAEGMYRHVLKVLQDALYHEKRGLFTLLRERVLPILVAAREPLSPERLCILAQASSEDVELLLKLLSSLFSRRSLGREGTVRIVAYHKTVVDWLTDPRADPEFAVDAKAGHSCLGQAGFDAVMAHAKAPQSAAEEKEMLVYALRHTVCHLSLAEQAEQKIPTLEKLVLDVVGFWPAAFEAGCGAEVLKDLMAYAPKSSEVVRDVIRWLRLTASYLLRHPSATLQLACDAPHKSLVAQKANSLPQKPPAKLLTKEHYWSACTNVMTEGVPNVYSVAVSGETVVAGSARDKDIRVFDLETGGYKRTLTGSPQAAAHVAISSGTCLVSGSVDGTLRVWDLETGECQKTLSKHDDFVTHVAISPDARLCASCSKDGTARIWDLADGTCKKVLGHNRKMYFGASAEFFPITVLCVGIHADAQLCVTGSEDWYIRVWDLADGGCRILKDHRGPVRSLAISSDAHLCVSGSQDKTIRVWDLGTGTCQKTLSPCHTGAVTCVAISPDARLCASGSMDTTIRVWELNSGDSGVCVKTFRGHTRGMSVAFTTDARIVSGSADCTIRVWELDGEACEAPPGHTNTVYDVQSSPDGCFCLSASEDKTLRIWDLENGACTKQLSTGGAVDCFAVDWNAHLCVSGSDDRTLRVWDLRDGKCMKTLSGHPGAVLCVAIHSGANLCVSGGQDSSGRWKTHLKVWDLQDGTCKMNLTGVQSSVSCLAISPDARFCVSGHWDETVRVWDLENGECKRTMSEGHTDKVTSVVISSDASLCVTGSEDETLRVWDLKSGEPKMELSAEGSPASLAISPDDRFCVSRFTDDTIRKWDISTGEQLACFCRYSEGGERLMALADCWRAGCHPASEGGPAGYAVAWPGDSGRIMQLRAAGAGSLSVSEPEVVYIMPPMCLDVCFRLFYAKSTHSVLFFDEVTCRFVRYQLLI